MEGTRTDWRSILLIAASAAGALIALAVAVLLVAAAVFSSLSGSDSAPGLPLLEALMTASALVLIACLLLPAGYHSAQRLRGRPTPDRSPRLIRAWQVILLIAAWVLAVALAALFYDRPILKWSTPVLYLLSIGLPVYALTRLATGGLAPSSPQRAWGVFGISMIGGPALAILAEGVLAVLALLAAAVYVVLNPGVAASFTQLSNQIQATTDLQGLLQAAQPYLNSPLLWLGTLGFLSVLTPLIEEPAKSIGVWLVSGRLRSAAEGFALGALAGAGFGLVESLLVSAAPDPSWGMTLAVRGASSMMHIFTAGLTGWGIASARLHKKYWHVLAAYGAAMFIHGLWNGAAVGMILGAFRLLPDLAAAGPLDVLLIVGAFAVLLGMVTVLPVVLGMLNLRLRTGESIGVK